MKFLTVIAMITLGFAEVDLFVPSFPELQRVFNLSPFLVQMTLSINFVTFCVSSLVVGSLGDRYSQRPLILGGIFIFIIGSVFCLLSPNFGCLILGRFLQGIGVSGPAVLAYVALSDSYSIEEQQKLMGTLKSTLTLGMALSPVVGSYVNLLYGWRGNFLVLLLFGVLCWIMGWIWIPSNKPKHHVSVSFKGYIELLKSPRSSPYVRIICFFLTPYWIFIGISPIFYMKDLGVPLESFGYYQGAMAFIFACVSLMMGPFLKALSQEKWVYLGLFLCVLSLIGISFLGIYDVRNPKLITGVLCVFAAGAIIPLNILYPIALESLPNSKGKMAAVTLAGRLILTAFGLQVTGYFYQGNFKIVAVMMVLCILVAFHAFSRLFASPSFVRALQGSQDPENYPSSSASSSMDTHFIP